MRARSASTFTVNDLREIAQICDKPVSYTHLDVYKRQHKFLYQLIGLFGFFEVDTERFAGFVYLKFHFYAVKVNSTMDCYLKKYKITNKARWLRETVLTFIHQKMEEDYPTLFNEHDMRR